MRRVTVGVGVFYWSMCMSMLVMVIVCVPDSMPMMTVCMIMRMSMWVSELVDIMINDLHMPAGNPGLLRIRDSNLYILQAKPVRQLNKLIMGICKVCQCPQKHITAEAGKGFYF
jgi:hypothetical protein